MKEKDTTLTPLSFISRFGEFCFDPCAYPGHSTAKNLIIYPEKCGLKERSSIDATNEKHQPNLETINNLKP